jgi:hypothetical protein
VIALFVPPCRKKFSNLIGCKFTQEQLILNSPSLK